MAQRRDSHSRVAVVSAGLRWARTGAVMSNPLLADPAHPEYCQGDCTGKGQPALRRVAPRHASLDAVRSQPGGHRMMTMTSRRWRWVSAGSADQRLAECSHATSGVRKASRAGSQTACLIKAGTLLNIWLYFHHGTHA
jgi:hypothetical protein